MTNLEYLQKNATKTRHSDDGKYTAYFLDKGIAVCNNTNGSYLWYTNPQPR